MSLFVFKGRERVNRAEAGRLCFVSLAWDVVLIRHTIHSMDAD